MTQPPTGPIPISRPIEALRGGARGPVGAALGLQLLLWLQAVLIFLGLGVALVEAASGEAITLPAPGTGAVGLISWITFVLVEPGLAISAALAYRSRKAPIRNLAQGAGAIMLVWGLLTTLSQNVFGVVWLLYGVLVLILADHASTRTYLSR